MYKIYELPVTKRNRENIEDYFLNVLQSPQALVKLLEHLDKCYDNLQENPFLYPKCRDEELIPFGYRKARVQNYIVLYLVDEEIKEVFIHAICHGSMDYKQFFL